ncbi:MAG TPA: hypothetical protein VF241_11955 [Propionibacteriaceae bacterium]
MQSDDDLRPLLRRHLSAAVQDRDRIAVAALREAIAALDNAEAIPPDGDLKAEAGEYVAGGVVGVGAAEAERRILDADSQRAVVRAEIEARLAAAVTYDEHGQSTRSADLRLGAEVLLAALDAMGGEP